MFNKIEKYELLIKRRLNMIYTIVVSQKRQMKTI